ncbi:polysaccharide deacetylase family protein [Clostridium saudiense]|uniref:polysaccharide deacetylase family protein n=1 Tax=Clostridium saudiense TaxID=1414720 RepID=UPI0018A9294A|nr:polysaccharide deacetylase family protein [Clostridium saudiense]
MRNSKRITNKDSSKNQKILIGVLAITVVILIGVIALNINKDEAKQVSAKQGTELEMEENDGRDSNSSEERLTYTSYENDINADNAREIENMLNKWNYLRTDGKKIAYLTFDDGPSIETTPKILETLRNNEIKATFFVLGSNVEKSDTQKELLKEMVKEGHAIGNHGYCHNYSILYPGRVADTTAFINDMEKSENVMKSVLGDDFSTKVIRFPGGHMSWKTGNLDPVLEQHGYTYIDWNVLNGDAEGNGKTVEQLINRLKETITNLYGNDDVLVVLMHDTDAKPTTAESLQQSIDYLKSLGYEFRTLK